VPLLLFAAWENAEGTNLLEFVEMKEHCYCHMLNPKIGTMVEPEDATHMRSGIPLCDQRCADRYDRAEQQRDVTAQYRRTRIGGENIGRAVRDVPAGEPWTFPGHRSLAEVGS
jgi:hypothetical protein